MTISHKIQTQNALFCVSVGEFLLYERIQLGPLYQWLYTARVLLQQKNKQTTTTKKQSGVVVVYLFVICFFIFVLNS